MASWCGPTEAGAGVAMTGLSPRPPRHNLVPDRALYELKPGSAGETGSHFSLLRLPRPLNPAAVRNRPAQNVAYLRDGVAYLWGGFPLAKDAV